MIISFLDRRLELPEIRVLTNVFESTRDNVPIASCTLISSLLNIILILPSVSMNIPQGICLSQALMFYSII